MKKPNEALTHSNSEELGDVLNRLMVCTAKHQGNPQEWIDGRCITPSQAKEAIADLLKQAELHGRIKGLNWAIKVQLPWPKDIFGKVPDEDWPKINDFAKKELGYPVDRISGDLMRHGWNCYKNDITKQLAELKTMEETDE